MNKHREGNASQRRDVERSVRSDWLSQNRCFSLSSVSPAADQPRDDTFYDGDDPLGNRRKGNIRNQCRFAVKNMCAICVQMERQTVQIR